MKALTAFQTQRKVFHHINPCFNNCLFTLVGMKKLGYILVLFTIVISGVLKGQTCLTSLKPIENIDSSIHTLEVCLSGPINDTTNYIISSCHLTTLYNKKSLYIKSEKILNNLLSFVKHKKNRVLQGVVINHLANTYKLSKDVAQALMHYIRATEIFESEKELLNLIKVYTDFAEYHRSLGQFSEAKILITKAFNKYHEFKVNDIPKLIKIYNRFAAIQNESSPSDSAMQLSLVALKLSRQISDKNSQAISLNEIGFILKNRLKVDSAMKCYKKAEELWTDIGAGSDATHAVFNQAMLLSHNSLNKKLVIPFYEKIIRTVSEKNIDYPLDQVYFELSNCYFFLGDSLTFYKIQQKYFSALLEKNQKIFDAEVNNIKEKYENEKFKIQISKVSDQLEVSERSLVLEKRENQTIYFSLTILTLLLVVIAFLAKRTYQNNKSLNLKNKEKDTLVQEIHHRVKNNLQFISSLINMQIHSSKNSAEIDSLNDASRRIKSMALVHEMFYNHDELKGIEINKYLTELISSINEFVNSKKIPISFNIRCEPMQFETSKAIALGMITSELVSNSIKYAFNGITSPKIDITLQKNENSSSISFIVRDNGKGLDTTKTESPEKLGMRLISIFSRQIKGEYSFKNNNGLIYTLIFNND